MKNMKGVFGYFWLSSPFSWNRLLNPNLPSPCYWFCVGIIINISLHYYYSLLTMPDSHLIDYMSQMFYMWVCKVLCQAIKDISSGKSGNFCLVFSPKNWFFWPLSKNMAKIDIFWIFSITPKNIFILFSWYFLVKLRQKYRHSISHPFAKIFSPLDTVLSCSF